GGGGRAGRRGGPGPAATGRGGGPGRRPASCRSPWGPGSACSGPPRWTASPAAGPASARPASGGTTRAPAGGKGRERRSRPCHHYTLVRYGGERTFGGRGRGAGGIPAGRACWGTRGR